MSDSDFGEPRGIGFQRSSDVYGAQLHEVYVAEIRRLIGLGTVLTGQAEAGEDLAHDAFVILARTLQAHPDYLQPPAWPLLRTIVVRLAIARRRSMVREIRRLRRVWNAERTERWEPDPSILDWRAAINRLPPRMRACVVLFYGEDMSTAAVSKALRCSPRTVENHLREARKRLLADPNLEFKEARLDDD